jgi:hypothetical protein
MDKVDLIIEQLELMLNDAETSYLFIEDYLKTKDPDNYKIEDSVYNRHVCIVLENVLKIVKKIKNED